MKASLLVLVFTIPAFAVEPNGDATIRGKFKDSEIVVTTTNRLAGAIHSVTWNGKEFINSHDHGRQLQSAASFDGSRKDKFAAERYNPTEAGSRKDGAGPKSSSKLLAIEAKGNELTTKIQMAFWVPPGEKTQGQPAFNDKLLSDHVVTKKVRIGYKDLKNVLDYEVTFTIPKGEKHTLAQFEALTGYMPPEFKVFQTYKAGKLEPLTDGPGEQPKPIIFSTEKGTHAMGIYSPEPKASYGRWKFEKEKVVKWNCVFRVRNAEGVAPGDYKYQMFVAIGTIDDVTQAMDALTKEHPGR